MNYFGVFLFTTLLFAAAKSNLKFLTVPKTAPIFRITNGVDASEKQFPYVVYLIITKGDDDYDCVGSIISEYYILTAAHCLYL